jgi:hypothetical protein
MSTVDLRPLRVGEILDSGIKLYLSNARTLMGAAATVVIPLQLLAAVVLLSTYGDGNDIPAGVSFSSSTTVAEAHARLGATAITFVSSLIGTALVTAACTKAVSDRYLDSPAAIKPSLVFALRRVIPLLVMLILSYLCLLLAFILLIIPGIWLYTSLVVATPALLIEQLSPPRALRRSRRLVKGRWWATAGVQLVYVIMIAVLGGAIGGALGAIALSGGTPSVLFATTISFLSGTISGILLQPFAASVVTVLYYDLRVRREGYDLQLLAEQLGLPEGSLAQVAPPGKGFTAPPGPESVGQPGGPPYWPPPPGWQPES